MTQSRAATRLAALPGPPGLRTLARVGLAVGLAALATAGPVRATTYRVHPDSTYTSIPQANALAQPGDSIEVSNAGSPYVHDTVMTLSDGVTYRGSFGATFQPISDPSQYSEIELSLPADSTDSVIDCGSAGSDTLLEGFRITGGNAGFSGGGIFAGPGTALTISDCVIEGNYSDGIGGGITIGAGSSVEVVRCTIRNNVARLRGGGISIAPGADGVVIRNCTVEACSSRAVGATDGGGGIFVASSPLLTGVTIRDCFSQRDGGAILSRNGSPLLHTVNMFDNRAVRDGGALYCDAGAGELRASHVWDSTAGRNGGAVFANFGSWRFEDCFFRRSVAEATADGRGGGAFFFEQADGALVLRNEISDSVAHEGGAIRVVAPFFARSILSLQIEANTIYRSSATSAAGAGALHFVPYDDGVGNTGGFADLVLNNIVSHTETGHAVYCVGALTQPVLRYNCVWNAVANAATEYGGQCADRTNINGNIRTDPQYCGPNDAPPNLKLGLNSPCSGSGEGGADMGAFPLGSCTAVSIEPLSWGKLKAAYR